MVTREWERVKEQWCESHMCAGFRFFSPQATCPHCTPSPEIFNLPAQPGPDPLCFLTFPLSLSPSLYWSCSVIPSHETGPHLAASFPTAAYTYTHSALSLACAGLALFGEQALVNQGNILARLTTWPCPEWHRAPGLSQSHRTRLGITPDTSHWLKYHILLQYYQSKHSVVILLVKTKGLFRQNTYQSCDMVSIDVYTGALFYYSRTLKGNFHPKPHEICLYWHISNVLCNSDDRCFWSMLYFSSSREMARWDFSRGFDWNL